MAGEPGERFEDAWLGDPAESPAEHAERLAADSDLYESLRAEGFAGPGWDYFANELARYGLAVIGAWIHRGQIGGKCAARGIRTTPLDPSVAGDRTAVASIANETVAEALVSFRDDVLARGKWDPVMGASLRTFFIGACLRRYPNAAARWARQQRHPEQPENPTDLMARVEPGAGLPPVEDDVIRSLTAQEILRGATNERAARTLALTACGYTRAEIAADLGISEDSVASILKRERARARTARNPRQKTDRRSS